MQVHQQYPSSTSQSVPAIPCSVSGFYECSNEGTIHNDISSQTPTKLK